LVKAIVTGGAGFIGSHIVDFLIKTGYSVVVIDNLSSGRKDFLREALRSGRVRLVQDDLKNSNGRWIHEFRGADIVYHFAANPEVRVSMTNPRIHFNENVLVTFNVLEACRINDVKELVFASSSTVYGDAKKFPTPEDYEPKEPISVYGAAKLASENLIVTYSTAYGVRSLILRFANIVGPRQSHGVIIDFIRKLRSNPTVLEILGDGSQRKSYLHVRDLISGIDVALKALRNGGKSYEVFNLGNEDWITVKRIAELVVEEMDLKNVEFRYKPATPDGRGWKGDVKFMLLDISKIKAYGWKPSMNSEEALRDAIRAALTSQTSGVASC